MNQLIYEESRYHASGEYLRVESTADPGFPATCCHGLKLRNSGFCGMAAKAMNDLRLWNSSSFPVN